VSAANFSDLCGDLLSGGRPIRFRASGSSMAPAIRDGDLLTVEPLATRSLSEGDIVLYPVGTGFRAHRVRSFDRLRKELICQGDNWFCRPEVVSADAVFGVVTGLGSSATAAPPRRPLGVWGKALRGRLGRGLKLCFRVVSGFRRAKMVVSAQASEEGRQGSTGKGSQR